MIYAIRVYLRSIRLTPVQFVDPLVHPSLELLPFLPVMRCAVHSAQFQRPRKCTHAIPATVPSRRMVDDNGRQLRSEANDGGRRGCPGLMVFCRRSMRRWDIVKYRGEGRERRRCLTCTMSTMDNLVPFFLPRSSSSPSFSPFFLLMCVFEVHVSMCGPELPRRPIRVHRLRREERREAQ
jgi:hypothetical protein